MAKNPRVEDPEDKDLQDHKMGMTAAQKQEAADRAAPNDPKLQEDERKPEPHAGGKA